MNTVNTDERLGPTPERLLHAAQAGPDAAAYVVTDLGAAQRLFDGDVLALLLSRGVINAEQHACGQEFFRHWYKSGLAASGVIDPARAKVDGGVAEAQSDAALFHLQRWRIMVRGLGQVHSHVLCDCVLLGHPLADYGRAHGPRSDDRQARLWAQARMTAALEQLVINELGPRHARGRAHVGERPAIMPT